MAPVAAYRRAAWDGSRHHATLALRRRTRVALVAAARHAGVACHVIEGRGRSRQSNAGVSSVNVLRQWIHSWYSGREPDFREHVRLVTDVAEHRISERTVVVRRLIQARLIVVALGLRCGEYCSRNRAEV